ncbi:unnamed protein product [Macrosiphum euphorbiae]|uniref:Uncharacterized protein n=1 Tax=Macrosiphum euphorbiae TaxID=13131 RepID=A0AAV0VL70_9HEMI|nr:unnamed protein product [Macrosiphum euphorbiae]
MQRNNSVTNKSKNKPKLSPLVITNYISRMTQDATSSPASSANNQEWNIVDINKRIRSPNNSTSPRTKKTSESPHFSSPNRYSLLNTNENNIDNMDIVTETEITSYSQAVIGNKSNKSDFNNTNDHISNQKLTNKLTTFISEFKTLISPLITLLNPLITLLTSLINKLSSNKGN